MPAAILTYHSLDNSGSVLSTSPRVFAEHMQILSDSGVKVISLEQVRDALSTQTSIDRLVAITFDDGFQNFCEAGLPILQRCRFPATVFLVTDYCGGNNSWPSQPRHIERRPLLRWAEVKDISAAGIAVGSHSRSHPDLTLISRQVAEEEMVSSKKTIEDAIGRSVKLFAYPYGAYNQMVKRLAQLHFAIACTTNLDFAGMTSDPLALERLDTYCLRQPLLFRRLFSRELCTYFRLRRIGRNLRNRTFGRSGFRPKPAGRGIRPTD
jgi:peptidoglycan/xylan/chitin deacetylase (PgdA/CDA1 family)